MTAPPIPYSAFRIYVLSCQGSWCFYTRIMTRHCHKCGWEWTLSGLPGRSESCHQCGADLRVCLNCVSYDPRVAHQCRDRRADPVAEKHVGNFCEYFDFVRRNFTPATGNIREASAREQLKKLLGD
jgi:hypothetical protein